MSAEARDRLRHAPWLANAALQQIFELLDPARTRAVGGLVRDTLMGRQGLATDVDLATELLPAEVMARAKAGGIGAYPTGIDHGTVTLRHGELVAEVTTLRKDVDTDGRHARVAFGTDWAGDAARRDFTMNALYAGADGSLFDPLGGLDDCLAARVRFIGDAYQRIIEDRLRVFRFFRFSASHGGQVFDEAGYAACAAASGTLGTLSAERVGHEMVRMLSLPRVAITLRAMAAAGVLRLPEGLLSQLERIELHAPSLAGRLALIMGAFGAARVRETWRLSNDMVSAGEAALGGARLLLAMDEKGGLPDETAYRYPDALRDAIEVAIVLGNWSERRAGQVRGHHFVAGRAFPLTGRDLVGRGMQPGKAMGAELARLEQIWIDSGFALDREDLLERARI